MVIENFHGYSTGGRHLFFLRFYFFPASLAFGVSIEKLVVILTVLQLFVTWDFLYPYVPRELYFWSCLFDNLYGFCHLMDVLFFRLRKISSMSLLKVFSVPLTCIFLCSLFFIYNYSLILSFFGIPDFLGQY